MFRSQFRQLAVALLLLTLLLPALSPAENPREDTSLRFVPEDVALYVSSLNNRKQLRALMNSNVFKKLMSNPNVQFGITQGKAYLDEPADEQMKQIRDFFREPINEEIIHLLGDMMSHEVFLYAGGGYAESLGSLQRFSSAVQKAQLEAVKNGEDPNEVGGRVMLEELSKSVGELDLGELVIGMKVEDPKRAERQLARLEELLNIALAADPMWEGRFTREKVGDADLMTLKLDGSMIPWDQVPLDDFKAEADIDVETFERLVAKAKAAELVASIGMYEDYILISIAPNNDHIAQYGKSKLLIDRPEFKGLAKAAGRSLTGVSYVSEKFVKSSQSADQQLDNAGTTFKQLVESGQLDAELVAEINGDIDKLVEELKQFTPEPGAVMAFSYMTDDGYESYLHNWAENIFADGSKPLSILQHIGGNPIFVAASRSKGTGETYGLLSNVVGRGLHYFDTFGVEELGESERESYEVFRTQALPLLKRADKVTREKLLPALADGQSALILDAQLKAKSWHQLLPEAKEDLPFPEIALVLGVSDSQLLKHAVQEYLVIAQEGYDKLREVEPDQIPPLEIKPPSKRSYDYGDIFFYQIPEQAGVQRLIAPNAGLSSDTLAFTLTPRQTKRLLEAKIPQIDNGMIDATKPMAAAMHLNWVALMDAIEPWINYAVEEGSKVDAAGEIEKLQDQFGGGNNFKLPGELELEDAADEVPEDAADEFGEEVPDPQTVEEQRQFTVKLIKQQVREAMDVMRCFKSVTSTTTIEGDVTVTKVKWQFQDLPAAE